jgi:hypothetical protein
MFLKDFLYFLVDGSGNSYRVNNGMVETSSTPTPLPVSPDGWQEKSIKYGRSAKYHGLFRSFTTPMKFVKEGAMILRDRLYKSGTESPLFMIIHRLDKAFSGEWKHNFFYKGELDLSKAEDTETYASCNIMEGDLVKLFKANEGTTYEIPINVPEVRVVKMDGLSLKSKTNYLILRSFAAQSLFRKQIIPFQKTNAEGYFFNLILQDSIGDLIDLAANEITSEDLTVSEKYLFEANAPISVTIQITGEVIANVPSGSGQAGQEWKMETSLGQLISMGTFAIPFTDQPASFSLSGTINLVKGERVFLYRSSTAYNNSGAWSYTDATAFSINTVDKYKGTFIKALPLSYVFQQLLNKITESTTYIFASNYLTAEWDNLLITGMDAVRGIDNPKMKVSFSKLYDSVNVPCNISLSLKDITVKIEEKKKAYGETVVSAIGEVKELVIKTAAEHQFNTLKIGYPNLKTEDVNGRDEFNVTQVYTSPVKKVIKDLNIISEVIASMYEIELTRINLNGKSTTNNDVDNDSCFLHVEKFSTTGLPTEPPIYYKLYRKVYDSITGIIDPATAFNIELSPKRCLLRHGNYLRSVFYWNESGKLKFQTSDRNADLKTVSGTEIIEEKADVNISDLAEPLFIPLTFNFKSPVPKDIIEVMENNPDQSISFVWNDTTWYGHVVDIGIQPADNSEQEVVSLVRPDNDILKLING